MKTFKLPKTLNARKKKAGNHGLLAGRYDRTIDDKIISAVTERYGSMATEQPHTALDRHALLRF
jgi:hypothetical protein